MLKLIEDDDSDDQMSEAGGDEVNYSNVEFFDDEQNAQRQNQSDYRLMNVTRDLQEALQDQSWGSVLTLKILCLVTLIRLSMDMTNSKVLKRELKNSPKI